MMVEGHIQWEAFKHPGMKCWGFRDDLGFAYISNDRDGWSTKRVVDLLNAAEARDQERRNPQLGADQETGQ